MVGAHHPLGGAAIPPAFRLVAEHPDDAHNDIGQRLERIEQRDAAVFIEHIAPVGGHGDPHTHPEILRRPLQPRRVAGREPQRAAVFRQRVRDGAADVRGSAVHRAVFPSSAGSTISKLPFQIWFSPVNWPVRIVATA